MKFKSSPRVARVVFSLFILFALIGSLTIETAARGRHPRGRSARKAVARGGKLSRRERRQLARSGRGGRVRLSKKEMRAARQRDAHEQSAYIAKLQKRAGRKLTKRELAAEMRKFGSGRRRALEEARRRAEAARQAAIARQRALTKGCAMKSRRISPETIPWVRTWKCATQPSRPWAIMRAQSS